MSSETRAAVPVARPSVAAMVAVASIHFKASSIKDVLLGQSQENFKAVREGRIFGSPWRELSIMTAGQGRAANYEATSYPTLAGMKRMLHALRFSKPDDMLNDATKLRRFPGGSLLSQSSPLSPSLKSSKA
jgi:hypothetical protein